MLHLSRIFLSLVLVTTPEPQSTPMRDSRIQEATVNAIEDTLPSRNPYILPPADLDSTGNDLDDIVSDLIFIFFFSSTYVRCHSTNYTHQWEFTVVVSSTSTTYVRSHSANPTHQWELQLSSPPPPPMSSVTPPTPLTSGNLQLSAPPPPSPPTSTGTQKHRRKRKGSGTPSHLPIKHRTQSNTRLPNWSKTMDTDKPLM